jgi:hypothetical protein
MIQQPLNEQAITVLEEIERLQRMVMMMEWKMITATLPCPATQRRTTKPLTLKI